MSLLFNGGKMKSLLIVIILSFLLITCAREPICQISISRTDVIEAIEAGEDCNSIAYCADGIIDESIFKACLREKEKIKNK